MIREKIILPLWLIGALLTTMPSVCAQQPATDPQSKTNNQQTDSLKNNNDSLVEKTTMLNEFVVESASRKKIPQGIAFFPSKREKDMATGAVNLIEMMALTELPYDHRANAVTTPNGAPVKYFIDGREATARELLALNPKDVERIEYYPMPTSGDFVGSKNVVNYVMKKYLSGGFTRLYAEEYLDGAFGNYALSSRLAYKKVTLDGYFNGGYTNTDKTGSITHNTFKDFTYNSIPYQKVEETIDGRDSRLKRDILGAFVKARWQPRALDLTGTIGWNWAQNPNVINNLTTSYSPEIFNSSFVTTERFSLNINPYAKIITKVKLPHKQSLNITLGGNYLSFRSSSLYTPQNLSSIFNGNKERSWGLYAVARYAKIFNAKNSLGIMAYLSTQKNNIEYRGSYDGTNIYKDVFSRFSATYSHSFSKATSLSIDGGFDYDMQRINGVRSNIFTPNTSIQLMHDWNDKSSIRISSNVFLAGYPASYLNDVTLRTSELLWRKGNPNLKDRVWWQSLISNTWNFTNNFSMTLNGLYTHIYNKDFNTWFVEPGREGVVESVSDDGSTDWWRAGTKLTYKLFNKKLVLTGSFDYDFYKLHGIYRFTKGYVKGSASVVWYGKNWYIGLVMVPATLQAYDNTNMEEYDCWIYRANLGYTYKNLNLRAAIANPFSSNFSNTMRVSTEHFSQHVKNYTFAAKSFQFTAIYTISYGKKVAKVNMQITDRLESGAMTVN